MASSTDSAALSIFEQACGSRRRIEVLMVPKTGSTLLTAAFSRSAKCNTSGRFHTNFHTQEYTPCSVATLRDPCERIVSQFEHLKNAYHASSSHGYHDDPLHCVAPAPRPLEGIDMSRPPPPISVANGTRAPWLYGPHCRSHWLHRTNKVDAFVQQLQLHWASEILAVTPKKATSPGPIRHMVIALPQSLWLGNSSLIICNKRITSDLPRVANLFGCHVNLTLAQALSDTKHSVHLNVSGRTWPSNLRPPDWRNLSAEGCRDVRKLYAEDARLYDWHCATNNPATTSIADGSMR